MNIMPNYGNPMMNQQYPTNMNTGFRLPQYPPTMNQPDNMGIKWVQGIEGAKAYQLMPNSNAMLLDSDNDGIFYIKVSDNVGMCTLRTFNYVETTGQPINKQPEVDMSNYVTRQELQQIIQSLQPIGGVNNGEQTLSTNESSGTTTAK